MSESPATRSSLLLRIRDVRDDDAWSEFVELYSPLVYGFARKHGLQDADAADLTQDVLRSVAAVAGNWSYHPERGSFRGWLFTVVRNKLRNFLTSAQRRDRGSGDTAVHDLLREQPSPDHEAESEWDAEYARRLFHWAAAQVRKDVHDSTWQAFWRTTVDGQDPKAVAQALGIKVAAVYLARSRVMVRLKERIKQLQIE